MKNLKINVLKSLLIAATLSVTVKLSAQALPPRNPPPSAPPQSILPPIFPQTFPVGVLTINCTVYTNALNPRTGLYQATKTVYTTHNLLNDLARDLNVTFPAGSYLEVFTTPYSLETGLFTIMSSGSSVLVTNKNGLSWNVSSYVHVGLVSLSSNPLLLGGTVADIYYHPSSASAMFMGSFHFADASNSIDLKGPNTFTIKAAGKPTNPQSSLSVADTLLMQSGSGAGIFNGAPAFITGQMLVTGGSVWNLDLQNPQ